MKRYLLIGGAALAAYIGWMSWQRKQALDKLQFTLVSLRPSYAGGNVKVACDVQIWNKTLVPLEVNGFAGTISIGSTVLGTVSSTLKRQIPAAQTVIVPFDINVVGSQALTLLIQYITDRSVGASEIVFNGAVNFLGASIPLTLTYKLF